MLTQQRCLEQPVTILCFVARLVVVIGFVFRVFLLRMWKCSGWQECRPCHKSPGTSAWEQATLIALTTVSISRDPSVMLLPCPDTFYGPLWHHGRETVLLWYTTLQRCMCAFADCDDATTAQWARFSQVVKVLRGYV